MKRLLTPLLTVFVTFVIAPWLYKGILFLAALFGMPQLAHYAEAHPVLRHIFVSLLLFVATIAAVRQFIRYKNK